MALALIVTSTTVIVVGAYNLFMTHPLISLCDFWPFTNAHCSEGSITCCASSGRSFTSDSLYPFLQISVIERSIGVSSRNDMKARGDKSDEDGHGELGEHVGA